MRGKRGYAGALCVEFEVGIRSVEKAEEYVNLVRVLASNPVDFVHIYINLNEPPAGFIIIPAANYCIKVCPKVSLQLKVKIWHEMAFGWRGARNFGTNISEN